MSSGGPPPVPGGRAASHRPPLSGGHRRRRRRTRAWVAVLLGVLLAPVAVAAAAYVSFGLEDGSSGTSPTPLAASSPPHPPPPAAISESAPPAPAKPVPEVPLRGVDAFHVDLRRPPRAGLVFDVRTGEVLWRRRPLARVPMASLTKIMTALLVVDRTRPNEPVRITRAALRYSGQGIGLLRRGKRVRLETLLNGMMIVSGNDAAIALAVHVSGSERRFVREMNRRARAWGLECTRFGSAHGLEDGNRSCPRDLAVLTRLAMSKRRIRRIVRRRQVDFRFPTKGGRIYLTGHNPLQRIGYPGTIGLKTGYTSAAGRCFVGVARRGGRTLGVVLLRSRDPSKHAPKLLDAAFATSSR
jgi:serine-type D-Ala-D-Ala carboxypeptidase (penicillin-binding protein 5/6)